MKLNELKLSMHQYVTMEEYKRAIEEKVDL